ncbi:hypothetical protein SAMN04487951_11398 [Vreelandella arcis]|uniref:Transposase n=1 Tax=Vreelandella arcis TaxID=416873 RepID=A0A1H0H024_9GAMM|nr:hypothetical protein SAMN04487951_11398 [Halomonas arcis]
MTKQQRNRYSDEFKAEALKLAENTSVASAARNWGYTSRRSMACALPPGKRPILQVVKPSWPLKTTGSSDSYRSRQRSWPS